MLNICSGSVDKGWELKTEGDQLPIFSMWSVQIYFLLLIFLIVIKPALLILYLLLEVKKKVV